MTEPGLTGRVLGGRYRLRSRLAAGGMGAVWAAEDAVLGREVAVKLLGEALAGDRLAALRLRREARAAGRLAHPAIARVLDLGEDGGRPYLVMELLQGESLDARLARAGPLAPADAVRIVAAAADALEVAHRGGIVHRDVKPGNVFVTTGGDVKLLDFGIASAAGETALTGGDLLGTAAYLAPERVLGHDATPAADIYALGVLLYELLAGRPPFTGESGPALAMAQVHARPAPLGAVAPQVPPALAAACASALAKDPAARPRSAAALAALLRSTLTADPAPRHPGPADTGPPTPVHPPAPALGAPTADVTTPAHPPAAVTTPAHRAASAGGVTTTRGAAAVARRGAWVAAALLLAALLAAVPSLGILPLDEREPARSGARVPEGGQTPTGGQASDGGGVGATEAGQGPTPAGAADRRARDPDDQDGRGEGSGGHGGGGGDGGSGGPG
jgi:hypothetical protein